MFQKLVAIEPVSLVPSAEKTLYSFAGQVVMYPDIPASDDEIIARIGDADAVLLSYTSRINRYVLECCPNVTLECVARSILPKVRMSIFAMPMNGVSR